MADDRNTIKARIVFDTGKVSGLSKGNDDETSKEVNKSLGKISRFLLSGEVTNFLGGFTGLATKFLTSTAGLGATGLAAVAGIGTETVGKPFVEGAVSSFDTMDKEGIEELDEAIKDNTVDTEDLSVAQDELGKSSDNLDTSFEDFADDITTNGLPKALGNLVGGVARIIASLFRFQSALDSIKIPTFQPGRSAARLQSEGGSISTNSTALDVINSINDATSISTPGSGSKGSITISGKFKP